MWPGQFGTNLIGELVVVRAQGLNCALLISSDEDGDGDEVGREWAHAESVATAKVKAMIFPTGPAIAHTARYHGWNPRQLQECDELTREQPRRLTHRSCREIAG
jgi:hypothetical protein